MTARHPHAPGTRDELPADESPLPRRPGYDEVRA